MVGAHLSPSSKRRVQGVSVEMKQMAKKVGRYYQSVKNEVGSALGVEIAPNSVSKVHRSKDTGARGASLDDHDSDSDKDSNLAPDEHSPEPESTT